MRSVASRDRRLCEEIAELAGQIARLVSEAAPALAALRGVGTDTAASVLFWSPSETIRRGSRARRPSPFCAAWLRCRPPRARQSAPPPQPYVGNRDANRALHVRALGRMSWDERRTLESTSRSRRTAEGKSKREILRCLKRYVTREVYRILTAPGALPSSVSVP